MKNGRSFLAVCVIELGLLGLAFWQIALYGTGASQVLSLAAALDFSPEEVQRIEVRHAGAEEQAWVLEDPAEAREAAEYLAAFRYTNAVEVGSRSGWEDLVEITTSGGTYSLELYPNAVEMERPCTTAGSRIFPTGWPARGEGSPRPCRKAPWKNWNPDREKRPPPRGRSFGAGGAGRKKLEKCEKHLAILPVRV